MNKIFYSLGASIASKLIMLLINIVSFRFILPEEYGFVALILALTATIGAVANMGASVAVNSFVAKNGNSALSKNFVFYNYALSFFSSLILSILVFFFAVDDHDFLIFVFIFFFSLFSSYNAISEAVLNGMQKFDMLFFNNVVNFIVFFPLSIFFIYNFNLNGVLISLIFYRLSLLLLNYIASKKLLNAKKEYLEFEQKKIIILNFKSLTLPVILSGLLVAPMTGIAFRIFTEQEGGLENLGYFNIIYQVYLIAVFIPNALNGYLISKFSRNDSKQDFSSVAKYNIIFSMLVALIIFLFKDIYFLIIDKSNDIINNNLNIMLCCIVLFSLNAVFSSFWPSIGKAWFGMLMNLVWSIVLLTVTYILSIKGYPESLAWAFLMSYLVLSLVQIAFYKVVKHEKV